MNIPAPAPLGRISTIALAAPFGWISLEQLAAAKSAGRAPVIMHRLGSEKARQTRGPREFREETVSALEQANWTQPWGLGGICQSIEDAAHFAVAGFTWFALDLTEYLEPRAGTMTLDELDAAIVALEDQGAFPLGWHDRYLGEATNLPIKLSDEALARSAVRFGAALAAAEQMTQAIRVSSSERGDLPDLELQLGNARFATSPEDLAFVAAEARHRGLIHGGVTRLAPSFGTWFEPGREPGAEVPPAVAQLSAVRPPTAILALPEELGGAATSAETHWHAESAGHLAWLRLLAEREPARFREWLRAAREVFPAAQVGWHVSTSEDDIRFLPEVANDALAATFLDTLQGRQLLLVTWQDVADQFAASAPFVSAAS